MSSDQYVAPADAHLEEALERIKHCAKGNSSFPWVELSRTEAAALLAKIEAADRLEWQPIETAPTDGTEFQAWLLDAERHQGWWEPRCRFNDGVFQVWQRVDYDDDGWDVVDARPTHWLPEPTEPPAYRAPQPAKEGE